MSLAQEWESGTPDLSSEWESAKPVNPQGNNFSRQLGIAARAAGPVGGGALLGAAAGSVIPGVGTAIGAGAGGTAAAILQLVDKLGGTDYLEKAMDQLGLPRPESPSERVFSDVAGTMTGAAGVSKGAEVLSRGASPTVQRMLQALGENQGLQIASAGSSALGSGLARESGAGPLGQTAAGLAAGMAVPLVGAGARAIADKAGDIGATIGASFGSERGTNRLARDAATRISGDSREKVLQALAAAKEHVPGVKPTVAEAIAEAQIGKPERFGGALVRLQKDLSGAKGIEDVLPSATRRQAVATEDFVSGLKAQTKPMREAALARANIQGVDPNDIAIEIDKALLRPGTRASDVVQKSLNAVKEKIVSITDANGKVNAEDLYTVRKEVGNTIGRFSKETANWDKKLVSGLERNIQSYIDDAIEKSGGTGWKDYLKTYSSGMKAVEAQTARVKEAKIMAAQVKGGHAADLAAGDIPKPPTLLSRPMMAVNYGLRLISRDANTPIARKLATDMQDPKKFAELMSLPPNNLNRKMAEQILLKATVGTMLNPPDEEVFSQ